MNCFNCQQKVEFIDRVGRKEDCTNCGFDAHVCKNCAHYDQTAYNECKETVADRVTEKEKSNFCDYFSPGSNSIGDNKKEDLMAQAEALFKK